MTIRENAVEELVREIDLKCKEYLEQGVGRLQGVKEIEFALCQLNVRYLEELDKLL